MWIVVLRTIDSQLTMMNSESVQPCTKPDKNSTFVDSRHFSFGNTLSQDTGTFLNLPNIFAIPKALGIDSEIRLWAVAELLVDFCFRICWERLGDS